MARSRILTGSPMSSTNTSPPLPDRARLQHQLHRLRDGHEVAAHLRVGDRHRAAGLDLPQERRHHAAPAAEHVAEPHRDEVPLVRLGDLLHDLLGHPLGRAHDAGRAHGLVGRDQHEVLDPELGRQLRHVLGAEHVVGDRLGDVALPSAARACARRRGRPRRGGSCSKTCRIRSRSRTSAMMGTAVDAGEPLASARPACRRSSSRRAPAASTWAGSSRASWRQSSLPIDPPAPVTSTVSPVASTRTCSRSVWIGSRRSRSWISTCRSEATATRPEMMSNMPGTVRVLTPASMRRPDDLRGPRRPVARGIAMITSSTS